MKALAQTLWTIKDFTRPFNYFAGERAYFFTTALIQECKYIWNENRSSFEPKKIEAFFLHICTYTLVLKKVVIWKYTLNIYIYCFLVKFSTFLKTVYIYKSSLKTYINHLQYINYFTTHNLQYLLTYDTLLTTSCLQWNPTITILFTMETLTEYCITELTLVALSSLIWICLKKFLGVPAKVIECWLNIYIVPFLVKDIYFALLSDVSFFLKEKTLNFGFNKFYLLS